jgi:hypothetical protein
MPLVPGGGAGLARKEAGGRDGALGEGGAMPTGPGVTGRP